LSQRIGGGLDVDLAKIGAGGGPWRPSLLLRAHG
jgi:hypothetical protein